jgi:hypothetical protein
MELEVCQGKEEVQKIVNEINALQIKLPNIHPTPVHPFTP